MASTSITEALLALCLVILLLAPRDERDLRLSSIGVALSLPGALKPLVTMIAATAADKLVTRGMRTVSVRRLFTALGLVPLASFMLLCATGLLQTTTAVVAGLFVAVPLAGCTQGGGYAVNGLDIAPAIAGMVLAVWNTFGQITGMAAPWVLSYLTAYPDGQSREEHLDKGVVPTEQWVDTLEAEWRAAFLVGGALTILRCAAYFVLASDQVQPWAVPHHPLGPRLTQVVADSEH